MRDKQPDIPATGARAHGSSANSHAPDSSAPGSHAADSNTPGSNAPGSSAADSNTPSSHAPVSSAPGSHAADSNTPGSHERGSHTLGSGAQRDVTSSRKKDHVELCVGEDVTFKGKSTGLERFELLHNALPEIDLDDVDTRVSFLGRECSMPLLVSSMTGGYADAERINRQLAEVCESLHLPMGVGSQRQALASSSEHESYRVARRSAPSIALFGNIGGAEIARGVGVDDVRRLADMIDADGYAVHLNPLQELMQPEGNPQFRGVLDAIQRLVRDLGLPVIVKEVGAGLSPDVVRRLLDVGVTHIDVAGAGGTSWSGVEILRREDGGDDAFWDWGIPTADALVGARPLCDDVSATLIASGGIATPRDAAVSIALGAHMVGAARPLLKTLIDDGQQSLVALLERWQQSIRGAMFLTGSRTIAELRNATLVSVVPQPL